MTSCSLFTSSAQQSQQHYSESDLAWLARAQEMPTLSIKQGIELLNQVPAHLHREFSRLMRDALVSNYSARLNHRAASAAMHDAPDDNTFAVSTTNPTLPG